MTLKPITLYSAPFGPNPWKVTIILTELDLPYEVVSYWDATALKKEPFTDINPNGRAPAIKDPNTNLTLWESCAIVKYLVDQYDKDHKLTITSFPESYQLEQWMFFQASGQGPYYGQAAWFNLFHPEPLPTARSRYRTELLRVVSVLDKFLSTKAQSSHSGTTTWLVGDKCTYVDLSFFMWDEQIEFIMAGKGDEKDGEVKEEEKWDAGKFPAWKAWHEAIAARPAVKQVVEEKKAVLAAAGGH